MESFANIVDCIQPLTNFGKQSTLGVYQGRCASGKTNEKLGALSFISQKNRLQSLQISSSCKFNFIFTSLLYGETLLIANSVHVSLISNWFTHAVEYIWHLNSQHLPVQTHHNNFKLTLSKFFGECEEIQSKLHSIVLTFLQHVWVLSVGVKLLCD